jgi:hypothetical protein
MARGVPSSFDHASRYAIFKYVPPHRHVVKEEPRKKEEPKKKEVKKVKFEDQKDD